MSNVKVRSDVTGYLDADVNVIFRNPIYQDYLLNVANIKKRQQNFK